MIISKVLLWDKCEVGIAHTAETGQSVRVTPFGSGSFSIVDAKFGKGLRPNAGGANVCMDVLTAGIWPDAPTGTDKGRISFWLVPVLSSADFIIQGTHEGLLGAMTDPTYMICAYMHAGNHSIHFLIGNNSVEAASAALVCDALARIKVDFVWNAAGIDRSSDTVRVYINKQLSGTQGTGVPTFSGTWDSSFTWCFTAAFAPASGVDFIQDNIIILDDDNLDMTINDTENPNPLSIVNIAGSPGGIYGGKVIMIYGGAMQTGITAKIGGIPCTSPARIADSAMACVTPRLPVGVYDVEVTNPDNQSAILEDGFEVVAVDETIYEVGAGKTYSKIQDALDYIFNVVGTIPFEVTHHIKVYAGTYNEVIAPDATLAPSADFRLIIEAMVPGIIIDGTGIEAGYCLNLASSFVIIDGFEIKNGSNANINMYNDAIWPNKLSDIIIKNCVIHDAGNTLIFANIGARNFFEDCEFYYALNDGASQGIIFEGGYWVPVFNRCKFHDFNTGFSFLWPTYGCIKNSLAYHFDSFVQNNANANFDFLNNTIILDGVNGAWAFGLSSIITTYVNIKNNIFICAGPNSKPISYNGAGDVTNIKVDNNCYYVTGLNAFYGAYGTNQLTFADWKLASGWDTNSIDGDPKCPNVAGKYKLQSDSPCIDTGTDLSLVGVWGGVTDDFDKVSRPQGIAFDMGYLEYYIPAPTVTSFSPLGSKPGGGTAITVTGTGFVDGATVEIGALSCMDVVFVDETTLTAVTPNNNGGFYNLTVTNPDTQEGWKAMFAYMPTPTILSITPNQGPVDGGTSCHIVGTEFLAGAATTIGGTACTWISQGGSDIYFTTPAHTAGAFDVVVTNWDSQISTLPGGFLYTSGVGPNQLNYKVQITC